MACDINGCGCKVCPGVWIAGLLLLVMTLQGLFFRGPSKPNVPSSGSASQQADDRSSGEN